MYECFLEIAFEAELNTKEDPELLAIAPEQCNEHLDTRMLAVTELRKMIIERDEVKPHRIDDEYLLRFLRSRDFIIRRAYKLLIRYYAFREQYPDLQQGVDLWGLVKIQDIFEGVMYDKPDIGRVTVIRFGAWNPSELSVEDVIRTGMAVAEIGIRQPKIQVLGTTFILDLEGTTLRQLSALTPSVAYQMVSILGTSMPSKIWTFHIINYSWIINTFFYIFKRFIPESFLGRIYFHGSDVNSLHQHIPSECLPKRYGGTCRNHVSLSLWLQKIKKYRDEQFDREMKALGYVIKE